MTHTIISGGTFGADTGGLIAGKILGLKTQGCFVHIEKNTDAEYKKHIQTLISHNLSKHKNTSHDEKDQLNVDMCDMLIAFRYSIPKTGRGTDKTIQYALTHEYIYTQRKYNNADVEILSNESSKKKVILIWNLNKDNFDVIVEKIKEFVKDNSSDKIMVSGPTEFTKKCEKIISNLLVNVLT